MRILLIATNRLQSPFPVTPVGVLAVAAAAIAEGHEVEVLDLMFARSPEGAIREALSKSTFDVVALGVRNLDNCFYADPISFLGEVRSAVGTVRANSGSPIIVGGSGFSVEPQGWLSRLDVDYGIVGEGEVAFVTLLRCIQEETAPVGLPGIIAKSELENMQRTSGQKKPRIPSSFVPDIKALEIPAHYLIDYSAHESRGGFVSIQAKRGCPFKCQYCVYPLLEGATYRHRAIDSIVDEIEQIARDQGVRHFFFSDSVFNAPRGPTYALCMEMIRRQTPVQWMAYVNSAGFDYDLAEAMVAAGCIGVEFGLDATTEKMLHNWKKPFEQKDIARSLFACERAGLPFAIHLLFGGPDESINDIAETQRFLDSCPTSNAVFASLGIRIYEGAPIAALAMEEGVIDADTDLFFPAWYVSPGLGSDPMRALDEVAHQRDEWSTATDWTTGRLQSMQRLMNLRGLRPQWLNASNYGKHLRRKPKAVPVG